MEIQIQCIERFLDILGFADAQDNLDSFFSSLRELEDLCDDSGVSSPLCFIYEDKGSSGFGFAIELDTGETPEQDIWLQGAILYNPTENRWSVAAQKTPIALHQSAY